jgi:hypothetical protein
MSSPLIYVTESHDVAGLEIVVALRFEYDPGLVELVKQALREARRWDKEMREWLRGGAWSPHRRFWWVDPDAWPAVRRKLLEMGVRLSGPDELMEPPPPKPKPKPPSLFDLASPDSE